MRKLPWTAGFALLVCATQARAQSSPDAGLVGTIRDTTGAVLVRAAVTVTAPQLVGGARLTVTDQRGRWQAPALPPGTYDIRVSVNGFRSAVRQGVRLVAGVTVTVDFELQVAGVLDSQIVEAPAPIIDVTSAAVPSNIGESLLLTLPTSRSIADLINLVPGVAGDVAYGGTKRTNAIYVDGVDTTSSGEQDPWIRYSQNWLQEVQVVGLGAEAEHGKFTGVAAHGIVRSGTNAFSGLGEYWMTDDDWVANNTKELSEALQRPFAPVRIGAYWNANGQLGGPIARDRLWFFTGVERTTYNHTRAGYDGPGQEEEDETRGILKLTAAPWQSGRLEGSVQHGRRDGVNIGLGNGQTLEATPRVEQPQLSWSARALGGIGRALLFDIRYTGYDGETAYEPQPPQSKDGPPGHYDQLTGEYSVNLYSGFDSARSRHNAAATGTWYAPPGLGRRHEVKFGVEIDGASQRTTEYFPGGAAYDDYGGEPDLVYLWDGATKVGDTLHAALFVQDRWAVSDRVTLLPGLRVDFFRGSTPEAESVFATNPVSPRVGLAWDVRADHRSVVRAHYGRYTDPAFSQAWSVTDDSHSAPMTTARVVGPGGFEVISIEPVGSSTRFMDPDLRQSYVDQVILGGEQEVWSDVSLQVQYIYRRFENFMAYIREGGNWAPVQRLDPGPDGREGTTDDGPMYTVYSLTNLSETTRPYTNPDDRWRRYHAVQAVARRRLADGWQVQASYTWSRATGTMRNGYHANLGVGYVTGAGDPNSLINGDASVEHDPTHEMKVLGSWYAPWLGGVTVAGVYRYMSGSAWGRTFVARGLAQGSATILAEPNGTRRVEAINNLDLRLEKLMPLGAGRSVGVFVDVFNVTNQGVPDSDWPTPVFTASGPNLGMPVMWRPPRQIRAAVRVTF